MRTRWIWPLATTAAIPAYFLLPTVAQSVVYSTFSITAAVLVLLGPGRAGDSARAWKYIGAGWMLVAFGNLAWFWFELVAQTPPFPSAADVFYLGSYVGMAVGLLLLARTTGRADTGALLDATVVAIGAGVLAWVILVTPYTSDTSLSLLTRLGAIAYPACDLLVLTLLLRLLFTGPTRHHPALVLLAAGFAVTLFANLGFAWVSLQDTFATGHLLDAAWLLSYVLVGSAALHPSARSMTPTEPDAPAQLLPGWRLVLLAVASLMAPALVVNAGMHQSQLNLVVMGIASAVLFLLVLLRMAGLVRRISDQAVELEALSTTDPLTGVTNRRGWDTELSTAVARAQRTRQPLAVALIDIDHFKAFNDTFGHPAGDALLAQAATCWQAHLRPGDLLARVGGEEFAVLLIACNQATAGPAVERLRSSMPGGATCSAGIAVFRSGETPGDLIGRADAALYRAKQAGRDRAVAAETGDPAPTPRALASAATSGSAHHLAGRPPR